MKKDHMEGVVEFGEKFGVPMADRPTMLDTELFLYRLQFLHEELHELLQAFRAGDLVRAVDALLDLEYVLHGTGAMMGVSRIWHELWLVVHAANMSKTPALSATASKRQNRFDIIKPPGWRGPEDQLRRIIAREIDESH